MLRLLEKLQDKAAELLTELNQSKQELKRISSQIKLLQESVEKPVPALKDQAETLIMRIQELSNAHSLLKTKEQHLLQQIKLGKTTGHGMNQHFLFFSSTDQDGKVKPREEPDLSVYKSGLFKS